MKKITLTAQVRTRKGSGKCAVASEIIIRLDGKTALAFAVLGGNYTPEDALKEFRKRPGAFQPQPGFTQQTVETFALAA
jgi:hypothetical protein